MVVPAACRTKHTVPTVYVNNYVCVSVYRYCVCLCMKEFITSFNDSVALTDLKEKRMKTRKASQ